MRPWQILFLIFFFSGTVSPPAHAQPVQNGLKAEIINVAIPANRRPVVTFKLSDAKSKPVELEEIDPNSVKFTIAFLKTGKAGESEYQNYILTKVPGRDYLYKGENHKPVLSENFQPGLDQGGALTRARPGIFTYTFVTALPANFDSRMTHTVGGEISVGSRRYVANPIYSFVPAGGKPSTGVALVETATCNNCHDPLKAHGGARVETVYCALCHTAQLNDPETGENLDFKFFIHKIHRGKYLSSVKEGRPYLIVGARQTVSDYSTVVSPQSVTTESVPKEYRNCAACHADAKVTRWKTLPSTVGCVSCHDDVDLKSGKKHPSGPAADGTCVNCHQPDGPEFGPSVAGAHVFPGNAAQLPGIVFDILKIEGGKPGTNPVVTFSLRDKSGAPVNAGQMNNLGLVLAWPTTDYKLEVIEDARKAEPLGNGVHTYKFRYAIPADATGSGAIGIQGYRVFDIKRTNGTVVEKGQRNAGLNVVKYFSITDREPAPRRKAVRTENCNVCHMKLQPHGEQRNNTEFCVLCHNANHTDGDKRKTAKGPMPPENVHYKRLIHRIHTGKNLGEPFVVYGGPQATPVPNNLGQIRFPGDRRNCLKCHEKGANELPLPDGVLPTAIPQADGTVKYLTPIMSACVGCHTGEPAKAHMEAQIASVGRESCVVCHGAGRDFAVDRMHRKGRD